MVADVGVVADVAGAHDEAIAAESGEAAAAGGAAGDGDVLADGVAVADADAGGFVGVLEVLWGYAEAAKGEMRLPLPIVRWPSRTTWEMSTQSSPRMTLGPMVQ